MPPSIRFPAFLVLLGFSIFILTLIMDSPQKPISASSSVPQKFVYSVWALPPQDVGARFRKLMEGLRSEFGGPQFEPHVTAVGAISLTPEEAMARFGAACDGLRAYTTTVDRVATGTFFYQCVLLLVDPTPQVVDAAAHCSKHFGYKSNSRMILLSKAAFNVGMNSFVFIFYRQLIGALVLIPMSLILDRKNATPLTLWTFCKIFMLALLGVTFALNTYAVGMVFTSATLAAAANNGLPVTTIIFAVLFRMEKVNVKTIPGIVKIFGILACIEGVTTLAFYEGPHLKPWFHHHTFIFHSNQDHKSHNVSSSKTWVIGCFLLFITQCSWGLWLVLQAQVLKTYPSKLSFTSLQCMCSAIQSFFVAITFERDPCQWKLDWNVTLLAAVYCGIVVNGTSYYLQSFVIEKKGPLFQAMSTPLALIITSFCSIVLLGEVITLGSILGGLLFVVSLYSVLWAKSKEEKMTQKLESPSLQFQIGKENQVVKELEEHNSQV